MCKRAVEEDPYTLEFVPDHFKTPEICERAVNAYLWVLEFVPMDISTQEMCTKSVKKRPWSLIYVPDHYVRLQEMWYEDYSFVVTPEPWHYDDRIIEWCNGYKITQGIKTTDKQRVGTCRMASIKMMRLVYARR